MAGGAATAVRAAFSRATSVVGLWNRENSARYTGGDIGGSATCQARCPCQPCPFGKVENEIN